MDNRQGRVTGEWWCEGRPVWCGSVTGTTAQGQSLPQPLPSKQHEQATFSQYFTVESRRGGYSISKVSEKREGKSFGLQTFFIAIR